MTDRKWLPETTDKRNSKHTRSLDKTYSNKIFGWIRTRLISLVGHYD